MKCAVTTETLMFSSQPLTQEEQDKMIKELEKKYGGKFGVIEQPMYSYIPFLIEKDNA